MLPTIDLSLIGILLIIWNVIKTIWQYVWGAIVWAKDHAIALMIGSKIWASATFFALTVVVMAGTSYVLQYISGWVAQMLINSLPVASIRQALIFIGTVIPFAPLLRLLSTFFVGWAYIFTLQNYAIWYIKLVGWLNGVKSSWKT